MPLEQVLVYVCGERFEKQLKEIDKTIWPGEVFQNV